MNAVALESASSPRVLEYRAKAVTGHMTQCALGPLCPSQERRFPRTEL